MLLSAGLVFAADRLTKWLVVRRLAEGQSVRVGPWLRLRHMSATAQSSALRHNPIVSILLLGLSVGILLFVTYRGHFFQRPSAQLGIGAALGGAAGNLYDRLRRGTVIDFLDLGWWPVFNVADAAITVGAVAALSFMR